MKITELFGHFLIPFGTERGTLLSNLLIPANQQGHLTFQGQDNSPAARGLSSLTATISDYAVAYVVANGPLQVLVVPKVVTAAITVTVTMNGKSLDGTALPAVVVPVDLAANAAPPPQATQVVLTESHAGTFLNLPADPGSATATIPVS